MNLARLRVGDSGELVAVLHQGLQQLGFKLPQAEIERRFFGPATRQAVRSWQVANDLDPSGMVDPASELLKSGANASAHRPLDDPSVSALANAGGRLARRAYDQPPQPATADGTGPRTDVRDLMALVPERIALDASEEESLARLGDEVADRGPAFWAAVESTDLRPSTVAELRTTVALAEMAGGDVSLVRALRSRLPSEPPETLADLATFAANDWITVAAQAKSDASLDVVERTAGRLAAAVEQRYPSASFRARLAAEPVVSNGYPVGKVMKFLDAHPGFDLRNTDVEPYLLEHGLANDSELRAAVVSTQRMLTMGATQAESLHLVRAGLTSATAVYAAGLDQLRQALPSYADDTRTDTLYQRAEHTVAATLRVLGLTASAFTGPALPALAKPQASPELLARFPSLETIFGDQSGRSCSHCGGVLGPAAYLVDLLRALDSAGVETALRRRRPDLAHVELTCANTDTELPYVDYVIEVLESAVAFPRGPIPLTSEDQQQLNSYAVPDLVRDQLAATVSDFEDAVTVQRTEPIDTVEDLAFIQGTRRWTAQRTKDQVVVRRVGADAVAADRLYIPTSDQDSVLEALRAGEADARLLALLAPELSLPAISGNASPIGAGDSQWPPGVLPGSEVFAVEVSREVTLSLFYFRSPTGLELMGGFNLLRADESLIEAHRAYPPGFALRLVDELNDGRVPEYIANLLPRATYQVEREPGKFRWLLRASFVYTAVHHLDQLLLTGLVFTGSTRTGDLIAFAENRNPAAYTALGGAGFPWSLPFDLFTEEVRASLSILGVSRGELLRALRPTLRNTSLVDAAEFLSTTPAQLTQLLPPSPGDGPSGYWGLAPTDNVVPEPTGDSAAPPVPADWVGALSRLSVLLHRSGVDAQPLFAALASQYVSGGAMPVSFPANEDRPSRITLLNLTGDTLTRLHRVLRLQRITGWAIRDLDAALRAVAGVNGQLSESGLVTIASLHEVAARLQVPLRHTVAWFHPIDVDPYVDLEAPGESVLPSRYQEVFLKDTSGTGPDPDFGLDDQRTELDYITAQIQGGTKPEDVTFKTLTEKIAALSRALRCRPADVRAFIDAVPALDNKLTLVGLTTVLRHVSLAQRLGLTASNYLLLSSLTDEVLFPDPGSVAVDERVRRLLRFADLLDDVRGSGFTFEQVAEVTGAPALDSAVDRQRSLNRLEMLADLQAGMRAAIPADTGRADTNFRRTFTGAGWPPAAVDRVIDGSTNGIGLRTVPRPRVTHTASAAPPIPAALPFQVEPGSAGAYVITIDTSRLAVEDADAAFNALAAISGLGPISNPATPSAQLKSAWQQLLGHVRRLATWLQSIELPLSRTTFIFAGPVPDVLTEPDARLRYAQQSGELILRGYIDQAERAAYAGLSDEPAFGAAVHALAQQADGYVERRPGSQLMSHDTIRDLISGGAAVADRFAAVLTAATAPLRRRSLLPIIAERIGVDQQVLRMFDEAAQLATPARDALAPLCTPGFLAADLAAEPADAAWVAAADQLQQLGTVVATLRVPSSELPWFRADTGFAALADVGFTAGPSPKQRFAAWHRTAVLYGLRSSLPAQAATLEAIRTAVVNGTELDDVLAILQQAYQLPPASTQALRLGGRITKPAELLDPLLLRSVVRAAQTLRRSGTTAAAALSLCGATLTNAEAQTARGLFAGKYGAQTASDGLRAAMNHVRERQRTALVDYLVQRDGVVDTADLHGRYLLDVEMGPQMRTSRVKQAISSVQLFIQRWLMNLEPELPGPRPEFAQQWEWTRSYRVWEANRNIFLFPEKWLEPNLRDDKTHLFDQFESAILQSEVTSERAIEALRQYVDGLRDISRMTVMAMYRETRGAAAGTVHLVGRTQDHPSKYYYRRWRQAGVAGTWEPWQPVDVINDTEHVVVYVRNGRPEIAWLQVDDATSEDLRVSGPSSNNVPDTKASRYWAIELQWSRQGQDGWSTPRKSEHKIPHPKQPNKTPRQTFVLRVETAGGSTPMIRCYGTSPTPNDAPVYAPWPREDLVEVQKKADDNQTAHVISVQVLGRVKQDTTHVPLVDALIKMWATTPPHPNKPTDYPGFRFASEARPYYMINNDGVGQVSFVLPIPYWVLNLTINVQVHFYPTNEQQQQTVTVRKNMNSSVRLGFVFDIDQSTKGSVQSLIDPARPLPAYRLATGDWGLGRALRWRLAPPTERVLEEPRPHFAEHYGSGYRFPANQEVKVGDITLGTRMAAERVYVAVCASDDSVGLGLPLYVQAESAAASGFVVRDRHADARDSDPADSLAFLPATEVAHLAVQRSIDADDERIALPAGPPDSEAVMSLGALALKSDIKEFKEFDRSAAQYAQALPYSTYDWEIFFHIPIMVARGLATNQRYADALRWLHTIFDPTAAHVDGTGQSSWWRFAPFSAAGQGVGIDLLLEGLAADRLGAEQQAALQAQIDFSRGSPFRPFGIARSRIRAFQWMTLIEYLKVLIAWGDQEFRRDSIESINEATQLYLLAAELLGRRPTELPERQPWPQGQLTFAAMRGDLDAFANASIEDLPIFKQLAAALAWFVGAGMEGTPYFNEAVLRLNALLSLRLTAFCVPANTRLEDLRSLVEDRLFKVRSSRNIDGVQRRLALFEPPIDPSILVRAVAAGLDISSVLNEAAAPLAPYRFGQAMQLATDFCTEVTQLGGMLLGALEKRDGEALARLRSTQELAILGLVGDVKCRQLDEAEANLETLRQSRKTAVQRYQHYQRLLGKEQISLPAENDPVAPEQSQLRLAGSTSNRVDPDVRSYGLTLEEADHLGWATVGNTYALISGAFHTASGIANFTPNMSVNLGVWGSISFGGSNIGAALSAVGQFFNMLATNAAFQSSRSSIIAGHQRRYDDWMLQSNQAGKEVEYVDKQILAAEIRVDLAKREIAQHDQQAENASVTDEFLREKFTNTELYQWMADRLTEVHAGAYQLAHDLARRAQRAYAFELGVADPDIVGSGTWDSRHRGLLAGERLSLQLKRLQSAYADGNRRDLELTKRISLLQLDPLALLQLQTTGSCKFTIPELTYDLDFRRHYFRRIKSVSVTVPCVVGPYTTVAGTLTLLENAIRVSPIVPAGSETAEYRRNVVPVQSAAISTGADDSGVFELDFRGDRYLPFEGAGAISRWRFDLPGDLRPFDYRTISDLVLQVRYTARDGGAVLEDDTTRRIRTALTEQNAQIEAASEAGMLVQAISLRHELPAEWQRPATPHPIKMGIHRFPHFVSDRTIEVWRLGLYLYGTDGDTDPPVILHLPDAAYTGSEDPASPVPWSSPVKEGAGVLYTFDLDTDDWTPVVCKPGEEQTWHIELAVSPSPASTAPTTLSDAVLVLWWRIRTGPGTP